MNEAKGTTLLAPRKSFQLRKLEGSVVMANNLSRSSTVKVSSLSSAQMHWVQAMMTDAFRQDCVR